MINWKIKQKIIDEVTKFGNIYSACLKAGVSRANYYRWKNSDKKFKEKSDEAEALGRENICDLAEFMLMSNIKKGDQRAIEYCLRANSEKYRQKPTSNVIILHKKLSAISNIPEKTLEDLIDDVESPIIRTEDSACVKDKQTGELQENQMTPNSENSNSSTQDKTMGNST